MEVQINDFQSTIRAIDGDTPLSPHTMEKIVGAVMLAVDDRDAHRERVRSEQRITRGVRYELEEMA